MMLPCWNKASSLVVMLTANGLGLFPLQRSQFRLMGSKVGGACWRLASLMSSWMRFVAGMAVHCFSFKYSLSFFYIHTLRSRFVAVFSPMEIVPSWGSGVPSELDSFLFSKYRRDWPELDSAAATNNFPLKAVDTLSLLDWILLFVFQIHGGLAAVPPSGRRRLMLARGRSCGLHSLAQICRFVCLRLFNFVSAYSQIWFDLLFNFVLFVYI